MSDRHFANDLPDYDAVPEHTFPTAQEYLAAGLSLKNEVVQSTWFKGQGKIHDPTLYVGALGTAFVCFRSYSTTGSKDDLALCLEIVQKCCAVASTSMKKYVTFICGRAGIYALGAAAAKYLEDDKQMHYFLSLLREMAREKAFLANSSMEDELLYGRAGYLWACLFVNKHIGEETVPWISLDPIIHAMIEAGRTGVPHQMHCPLMYEWHGTKYWGAAHGLAGIMHLLLHFPLSQQDSEDVRRTLFYMIENRFPSGNYRCAEDDIEDNLVHWCHGAPGLVLTLCKAAEVFPSDPAFKEAAISAGEVVWKRGLLRRVGICHGVSGNAYTFLALYRLTGSVLFLHRANAFASFLFKQGRRLISSRKMHGGDHPYSLFEGLGGTACLYLDMVKPEDARFPAYEM